MWEELTCIIFGKKFNSQGVFHEAPFTSTTATHSVPDTGYSMNLSSGVRCMWGMSLKLTTGEMLCGLKINPTETGWYNGLVISIFYFLGENLLIGSICLLLFLSNKFASFFLAHNFHVIKQVKIPSKSKIDYSHYLYNRIGLFSFRFKIQHYAFRREGFRLVRNK